MKLQKFLKGQLVLAELRPTKHAAFFIADVTTHRDTFFYFNGRTWFNENILKAL